MPGTWQVHQQQMGHWGAHSYLWASLCHSCACELFLWGLAIEEHRHHAGVSKTQWSWSLDCQAGDRGHTAY